MFLKKSIILGCCLAGLSGCIVVPLPGGTVQPGQVVTTTPVTVPVTTTTSGTTSGTTTPGTTTPPVTSMPCLNGRTPPLCIVRRSGGDDDDDDNPWG